MQFSFAHARTRPGCSGALARASLYFKTTGHGPTAKASDVLARASQASRYDPNQPERQWTERKQLGADAAYVSRLAARAVSRDSAAGWLAVARQISRVGNAVAAAERARGRLAAAQETTAAVSAAFAVIERAEAQRTGATAGTFAAAQPGHATYSVAHTLDSDRDRGRGDNSTRRDTSMDEEDVIGNEIDRVLRADVMQKQRDQASLTATIYERVQRDAFWRIANGERVANAATYGATLYNHDLQPRSTTTIRRRERSTRKCANARTASSG